MYYSQFNLKTEERIRETATNQVDSGWVQGLASDWLKTSLEPLVSMTQQ